MTIWDPSVYQRYKTYRDRPALDLMVQIPADLDPLEIWDLGCGVGEHAAVLSARHPGAKVHGLDSSPEMLARARETPARVDWVLGDIAAFAPERAPDLLFTNAALQWLDDLDQLVPRLAGLLNAGGVFACQVPLSHDADWYATLRDTAADPRWAAKLADVGAVRPIAPADAWYDWLSPICGGVDIWATTYLHVLEGEDPVVDWMSGTGLRPYLQALEPGPERQAFIDAYADAVARAFPRRGDGTTLFPFPRLFILARR